MAERPAIRALRASGWYSSRCVDIAEDLAAYERQGFVPFAAAVEVLREYSGLTICFDRPGGLDEAWFSGRLASTMMASAWVEDYSLRAGIPLLPVGAAYTEHLVLLVGTDGSWYGGYDDVFGSLGGNFLDSLENIIENREFVERL